MEKQTVSISLSWLQGMISQCLTLGVIEFDAAVIERGEKNVLSTARVGGNIVPKFGDENPHAEQQAESYQNAIDAGLSPIWRDAEGNFCRKKDDSDGLPEFYLENASDVTLKEVAKKTGVPVKEGLTRDNLILKLQKHFGFKIEESGDSETGDSGEQESSGSNDTSDAEEESSDAEKTGAVPGE